MKWCKACVLPDTRPNLYIGDDGVCNACKNHSKKGDIDWEKRRLSLMKVVEAAKARSKGYDCLIPVSGGKDSTWQVIKCLELGLNILAVTWRPPGRTEIGQKNLDNLISLGVDHIDYSINPKVEANFMLEAFKKYGSTAIPMHMALFNIPIRVATKFDIPLVIWGENSADEYGSSLDADKGHQLNEEWLSKYGVTHNTQANDWIGPGLTNKAMNVYQSVSDNELLDRQINAIFLGYYLRWDPVETKKTAEQHGFSASKVARTGYYKYADIDDDFISIHHWLKWYKFGFTRLHDNLSLEIRNGRITRSEALEIIVSCGNQEPSHDIQKFCEFSGITRQEFNNIAESHRDLSIWKKINDQWVIPNFLIDNWAW